MICFVVGKYPNSFFKSDLFKKDWRGGEGVIRSAQIDMLSVTNIIDNVCKSRLFSFPYMAEEQEYLCCLSFGLLEKQFFSGGGVLFICS